ncbi:MAG: hypothetical protein A3E98_01950 [Candidatus Doudnabacteria bacterium RIFCSPHIGHO2_12_FULL_48_11]|uniref:Rod shape-determining protein MreD n=1 Tax=Candidatus Doudnabacteria bacterium RIFCSPHIGHO2_01_FULL_46_24 TaxID=1817825 RepID=A0A1F5NVL2_9BACT|nr:MAG: hypothetical protein A2720_02265 [Candidatus Doudnabacteria bacterium RIFCSPHIGHO2_01_FULL_46_24]OGE95554.1 MAG: hypothetical protein A3E98_01950 [Candidatus Doudnabacteria bacterium RIFCSPHIGHO2_12_FULL_48_11]
MAYLLVLIGALLRVLPHPANFAPIGAVALFGGVYLPKKFALALPIAAMVVSDFFIGFDSWQSRVTVYGSFLLIGLIGLWVRQRKNLATVIGGSLVGSVIFYLITNFAFFYSTSMYSHDLAGVMASYINAIPFFRNTILGDLFYTTIFFGSYELVRFYVKNYKGSRSNSRA